MSRSSPTPRRRRPRQLRTRPAGTPDRLGITGRQPRNRWRSAGAIFAASAVLLAGTVLADLLIDPRVAVLTVFFGLAPLLAASALTPKSTAGFALAAGLFAAVSGLWNQFPTQYWLRLADVALVGALAVLVAAVRARREADLRTSRHIAGVAQQALLPVLPHQIGPVYLSTRYHSATATAQVGGDFFDFVADGNRIRLILGDISGKGVEAVTQAARVIRAFRQYGASEADLLGVARRVDEYVTPFWGWEYFATAIFIEITDNHTVSVVSAGHPPPFHASADGITRLPIQPCVPLGLGAADRATEHTVDACDRLLLYTDGLIEARDHHGQFLPDSAIHTALRLTDPDACLETLLASVRAHAGTFEDDLALLLMTFAPRTAAADPEPTAQAPS